MEDTEVSSNCATTRQKRVIPHTCGVALPRTCFHPGSQAACQQHWASASSKAVPTALCFPAWCLGPYALWRTAAAHIAEDPSDGGLTGNLSASSQGWTPPLTREACGPGSSFQDTPATLCLLFLEAPHGSAPSSVLKCNEKGEQCCTEI